ncbi:unnamed protein product [Effrenium voratum]|nr:unnamed protein product [Effrenium voratum]|eukprot:CAMPEP_0181446308 /NCGR_PEP_ID=MMETSP1110-20121109/26036_1 /TAXON_ID=174948 /ORGANISM="Symbiodinium sp., Strain CCMP421" /LENGTH=287 /DNA_ID=CAMNT_0023570379 /DNA_START=46 /DNA_END=909 /DNA_ORIENTATION=+
MADLGFALPLEPVVQPAPRLTAGLAAAHRSAGNSLSAGGSRSLAFFAAALCVRSLARQAMRPRRSTRISAQAVRRKEEAVDLNLDAELSQEEADQLQKGLPVQRQHVSGRKGQGVVMLEVDAPWFVVLDRLRTFEEYPGMIPVIRAADVKSKVCDEGRHEVHAQYRVSKFWLNISVIHSVDVAAKSVSFKLHPTCGKLVLKNAVGSWTVCQAPDDPDKSRVTLQVCLEASSLLPTWLIDYAAERALRRATSWLPPHVEAVWKDQKKRRQIRDVPENLPDRQLHYLLA